MHALVHELHIALDAAQQTVGACSCGAWTREASLETIAVTGRSREETLRAAHETHVREALAPRPLPRVPP